MTTHKQQEQLLEVLKFTPRTYRIEMVSYGGEVYAGRISREIYEYFKANNIDLTEYSYDWDNGLEVPENMQPFTPGSAYECDDLIHASGATMHDCNFVHVYDEHNDLVWECDLSIDSLSTKRVKCVETNSFDSDVLSPGEVVYYGASGEKGLLFGGNIELSSPFDPVKLKLDYCDANGWLICNGAEYDGEYISNDDVCTTGKWSEHKWILGSDEEAYDPDAVPDDEKNGGAGSPSCYTPTKSEVVEFKFKKHQPVHQGWYYCCYNDGTTFGMLYWDGDKFVDFAYNKPYNIKQAGIIDWTGINWDTSNWDNCPQS